MVVKKWNINPWEIGKLTPKDLQWMQVAEHTRSYLQQEQRNQQQHNRSENFGNVSKSRQDFRQKHGA